MDGDAKNRSHLPIPTPERTGLITYDAKDPDTKFPPIEQLPTLYEGTTPLEPKRMPEGRRLSENCVLNIKNKSHSVTAEIEIPKGGAEGVIIAQGANIAGWSFYAKER
jgi:hypothetical protein